MLKTILAYGTIAGLIAGIPLSVLVITAGDSFGHGMAGMAVGYLIMLVALTMVFVAIKRHRDEAGGGVIRFWPALGLGVGISFVASLLYVASWETACAIAHLDFGSAYAEAMIASARAKGASGGELAKAIAEAERFRAQYANPLFRLPMTFMEIFPVGLLVSLISAGLLRSPRFMPARREQAAA